MPTTSSSALRYPSSSASPNVPQDIQNLATDLDRKVLPQFATIAARNTAIPSPVQGQTCTVNGLVHTYTGALGWQWENRGLIGTRDTNTGGFLSFDHGLGATPTGVIITPGKQATDLLDRVITISVYARNLTTVDLYVKRTDTSAALPSTAIQFAWIAFV